MRKPKCDVRRVRCQRKLGVFKLTQEKGGGRCRRYVVGLLESRSRVQASGVRVRLRNSEFLARKTFLSVDARDVQSSSSSSKPTARMFYMVGATFDTPRSMTHAGLYHANCCISIFTRFLAYLMRRISRRTCLASTTCWAIGWIFLMATLFSWRTTTEQYIGYGEKTHMYTRTVLHVWGGTLRENHRFVSRSRVRLIEPRWPCSGLKHEEMEDAEGRMRLISPQISTSQPRECDG